MDAEKLNDLLRKQITLKPLENLKVELSAKDYRKLVFTENSTEDYILLEK